MTDETRDSASVPPRYMRRNEAAEYLAKNWGVRVATGTLMKLASVGGGPVFHRFGRWPIYTPEALDDWARARLSGPMRSTSEAYVTG